MLVALQIFYKTILWNVLVYKLTKSILQTVVVSVAFSVVDLIPVAAVT